MTSTATILSTKKAVINGKTATVQTVFYPTRKQEISYTINGKEVGYNHFWSLKPRFKYQS